MRVLLGLAALAASVSAQSVTVLSDGSQFGDVATIVGLPTSWVQIRQSNSTGAFLTPDSAVLSPWGTASNGGSITLSVANSVSTIVFQFYTSNYTAQAAYRWSPNYSLTTAIAANPTAYTAYSFGDGSSVNLCDPCTLTTATLVGDPLACSRTGPGGVYPGTTTKTPNSFKCANLSRYFRMTDLVTASSASGFNTFFFTLYPIPPSPQPYGYTFKVVRADAPKVWGDPQIVGMQGQDFQVHGIPDEVFNMVSYPTLQINARFSYLESADCFDNFTACFAHPGTYISEEGFRVGKDKVRVTAGSHKKGLTVHVNGKKVTRNTDLKLGAVEIVNHRRVVVHTNIMKVSVSNSDKFLNQELELNDDKLISLGSKRRHLKDNEKFHSEVPLHGLQGQTWRNVEYASGLDYEGSITDYHVVDGNLFGTDFVFNQFEA